MIRTARLAARAGFLCAAGLALGACAQAGRSDGQPDLDQAQLTVAPPKFDPASVPKGTYIQVGQNLLAAREPDLAYDAFLTSIRVDGISAPALVGAGIAQEQLGLLTTAKRYMQQAVETDPNSIPAYNNLGVVLFKLNEYYPARDAFRTAYALSSGRSEIAERNLNRVQAIIVEIEAAGQQDPEVSHRVVRLGTSEFRITPIEKTPAEMIGAE